MKKPILLLAALAIGLLFNHSYGQIGTYASAVWMNDCNQDDFFNTTGSAPYTIGPSGNTFAGTDFGIHTQNSGTLKLRGGEVKTSKTPGVANVCGAYLYYRIYPQSGTPGAFNMIDLIFSEDCDDPNSQYPSGGFCSPGDQRWNLYLGDGVTIPYSPVDLTAFPPGNYVLEINYKVAGSATTTSGCQDTVTIDNGGANFIASFTIQSPLLTGNNPTSCNGTDGSIVISGLKASTSYSISYNDDGSPIGPSSISSDGSGQITIAGLNAGTYSNFSLTVNGCTTAVTPDIVLTNQGSFPVTINSTNPTTCNGTEGSIIFTGLTPGTTYDISYSDDGTPVGPISLTANGSGQITITGLDAGIYSSFVLSLSGCTTTLYIGVVLSNPIFIPSFTSIPPICAGNTPPALPTTSNNGITGTWSPAVINNMASGTYTFTPTTGQCGIPVTINITITPRVTPTFAFGTSLTNCAGGSVPSLPNTSTNGINGTWSPATVDNQNSGTYTFTPNGSQCANTATFNVTVNPNITPTFSFGTTLSICAGESVPALPTSSSNGITGTWSPTTVDNQNSGTYSFTPDPGQCALSTTFDVTVNPILTPVFSFGTLLTICAGAAVPSLPTTSDNGVAGTWNPSTVDDQNSGTYTFTPSGGQCANPASFSVTVNPNITPGFPFGTSLTICAGATVPALPTTSDNGFTGSWSPAVVDDQNSGNYAFTPDPGQCATTATFSVTVNPNITPTFSFGTTLTVCAGATVTALPTSSANSITGTWSPAVVDDQNSGVYTFTPDAGQCATTATFTVTVNPNITPTFSFGSSLTICTGASVPALPATSDNGINGTWSPATVDNQTSATYTFTPTAGQCAPSVTFSVTVNPNILPTFSFGTSVSICAGGTVPVLPGTSDNGITGTWSPAIVDDQNSGTYTFTPTAGQCATTATLSVTVNPILTPTFAFGTSITICAGSTAPALPTTSDNGITGTWSPSTIDNMNDGTYNFIPSAGQCATGTSLSVTVTPVIIPVFSFGTTLTICAGGTVPALPATSDNGIDGTWNPSTVSNQTSGTYTFTPTPVTGQCTQAVTFTVTVNPIVTPSFSFGTSLSTCIGATMPVLPANSTNGISGTWSPATVDNQNNGSYTFTPGIGQCAVNATFTVTLSPVPTVNVRSDTTILDGAIMPGVVITGTPPTGVSYNWTNSNAAIGLAPSGSGNIPSFTGINMGDAPINGTITVTPSIGGCTGTPKSYVVIVNPLNKDVFVPNVFTPNNDGKNDILYVYGNYIQKLEMHIFNQWGEQIAVINNKSQGWDGTERGKPQPVGVYVYVLKAELSTGKTVQLKGSITLLR